MSGPIGSSQWMYNPSTSFYDHTIDQSLRFEHDNSSKLYWSPTSTGNQQTWTLSLWVKRVKLNLNQSIFTVGTSSNGFEIRFNGGQTGSSETLNDTIIVQSRVSTSNRYVQDTVEVFRDLSAWYHIVYVLDATQSTNSDRAKLYVNGTELALTAFTTNHQWPGDAPGSSLNQRVNVAGDEFQFGISRVLSDYSSLYLAEINFVDGTALQATDFGETKNGVWVPKSYTGSYGTNGFYLTFEGTGEATTSQGTTAQTNIGDDQSGNGNNFAIQSSSIGSHDVVPDSPTNNFATLNALQNSGAGGKWYAQATLTQGSLQASLPANSVSCATMKATGKLYAEVRWSTIKNELALGLIIPEEYTTTTAHAYNVGPNSWKMAYSGASPADIFLVNEGTALANPAQTVSVGDIFQIAWDTESGKIWFGYNNSWYDSSGGTTGNPSTGANPTMTATTAELEASFVYIACGNSTGVGVINFGQDSTFVDAISPGGNADANGIGDFAYAPPTGHLAICTSNLAKPDIGPNSVTQSDDNFNTVLYTGDDSNGTSITGVGFQPDFVWIKSRSGTAYHELHDSVRGAGKRLFSNEDDAETTVGTVSSFDTDGFTVSRNSAYDGTNQNGVTFVGWSWKAGGAASSIAIDAYSSGVPSIASSVSANSTSGFSIVSWTGTGATGTIGHGLSSAPEMIMVKNRELGTGNWHVYHKDITDAPTHVMYLNLGNKNTDQARFNDTTPTNTVFSIGSGDAENKTGDGIIAYCFHSVDGFSKVGKYRGNGDEDGTFIYTGFRPAWIMVKNQSTDNRTWQIYDSKRDPNNVGYHLLQANEQSAEATGNTEIVDFYSNGFKMRNTFGNLNTNGDVYIFLSFAEQPFKNANAR